MCVREREGVTEGGRKRWRGRDHNSRYWRLICPHSPKWTWDRRFESAVLSLTLFLSNSPCVSWVYKHRHTQTSMHTLFLPSLPLFFCFLPPALPLPLPLPHLLLLFLKNLSISSAAHNHMHAYHCTKQSTKKVPILKVKLTCCHNLETILSVFKMALKQKSDVRSF